MKILKKRGTILIVSTAAVIFSGAMLFANFTKLGYMMTLKYHGFTEVRENIFVDESKAEDINDMLTMIDTADGRLKSFWGDLKSSPTIIISYKEKNLSKLGYTGSPALTSTYVFNGAHNYVTVSPKGVDVDVLAHELTHAELHTRIYKDKWTSKELVPIWFDEGTAMQNDYRDKYNEEQWQIITDNGKDIRDVTSLNSQQFFDSDKEKRVENFILANHEVNSWIKENGKDELISLLDEVNSGKQFNSLYDEGKLLEK